MAASSRALAQSSADFHVVFICLFLQPFLSSARKFAAQFAELEAENARLREELQTRVAAANKLTEEAWEANEDLKKELAQAKEEIAKAKEAEEQKKKEEASADKALRHLLKAVEALLGKFSNLLIRVHILASSCF